MKVFNLTDVETPLLKQRGLGSQHIAVGDKLLAPGTDADIDDATLERTRPELQRMVSLGTLALGEVPADYKAAKEKATKKAPAAPAPESDTAAPEKETPPKRGGR